MRGLGFIEISYSLIDPDTGERQDVTGVQIGRLAVRQATQKHFRISGLSQEESDQVPWRVDHFSSGIVLGAFDNAEDAYAFADDFSRFAKKDLTAKRPRVFTRESARAMQRRLRTQAGPAVTKWAFHLWNNKGTFIPFRAWLAERGG